MKEYKSDVVVVGAGPAGSFAALNLAKGGHDVLVIEKRQEIGAPKRCAEGLSSIIFDELGIKPNPKWAPQEIRGSYIYSPSMKRVEIDTRYTGYILERKVFEKHLASWAIQAGARYMVKATVTGVLKEGAKVVGVEGESMDGPFRAHAKIVIAADGVDSMTAKWAGIDTVNPLKDYHSGFQYEMAGVNAAEDKLHIFLGNKMAPKGYAWIFPKGETIANVGIGIVGSLSGGEKRVKEYLDDFIRNNPQFFKGASQLEMNSGGIPVSPEFKTLVDDNFMIVGDAAHQVNPIHGGGIGCSMRAARVAAEVASAALREGDTSKKRLKEYERLWEEGEGSRLKRLMKLRLFLEKLSDEDFELMAGTFTSQDVMTLVSGDLKNMIKFLMFKAPRLLPLARKFFD
jgi:digeranylgeranylglycerophospholipid reductase